MKKDELITFVSESADITKKSAGDAINPSVSMKVRHLPLDKLV